MSQVAFIPFGLTSNDPQSYMLVQTQVVARGVMFAGIVGEVQGGESRVTECLIVWFAMFSFREVMIDLLEVTP